MHGDSPNSRIGKWIVLSSSSFFPLFCFFCYFFPLSLSPSPLLYFFFSFFFSFFLTLFSTLNIVSSALPDTLQCRCNICEQNTKVMFLTVKTPSLVILDFFLIVGSVGKFSAQTRCESDDVHRWTTNHRCWHHCK